MAKSLREHLDSQDGMAHLAAHAKLLLQQQSALETALPPAWQPYVRVTNYRAGKVSIHAISSAMATKIRQMGPTLATILSSPAAQVTEIGVRVQAASFPAHAHQNHTKATPPEPHRRQALLALATSMAPDDPLRHAIERLLHAIGD
jgi:hypothetical protein